MKAIDTIDIKCFHCNLMTRVPVPHEWSSPLFIFEKIDEIAVLRGMYTQLHKEMHELAVEALNAGCQPSLLERMQATVSLMTTLRKRYNIE